MANDRDGTALRQIDRLFQAGSVTGLDDGQLLDRFVANRDESAVEARRVAWPDGPGSLPPLARQSPRRPRCVPGDLPDPGPQGPGSARCASAGALAARCGLSRGGPPGPTRPGDVGWSKPGPGTKPSLTFSPRIDRHFARASRCRGRGSRPPAGLPPRGGCVV